MLSGGIRNCVVWTVRHDYKMAFLSRIVGDADGWFMVLTISVQIFFVFYLLRVVSLLELSGCCGGRDGQAVL